MSPARGRVVLAVRFAISPLLLVLTLTTVSQHAAAQSACAANYHVQSGACVACGPGLERAAGDDPTGADTDCTDVDGCPAQDTCAGTCFDDSAFPHSSYSCDFFYSNSYCRDGGVGPAWNAAWRFSDYANPSNGLSPLDACCDCGGGSGVFLDDADRGGVCVDVAAPDSVCVCDRA
jgi:hypothetical protein